MPDLFFTSDTHFGHERILTLSDRPWSTVEEMDEALIAGWNSVVKPGDMVFHLGDLSFHKPEQTAKIIGRLNGYKTWILGNHDRSKKKNSIASLFGEVKDYKEIKVSDDVHVFKRIVMCHFPMLVWNKSHYGSWMLHGHSHGSLKHPVPLRLMDVGVDCHPEYRPFSLDEVRAYMAEREHVILDHHKEGVPNEQI